MSMKSPEPMMSDSTEEILSLKKDIPRKRSKVSRACDACRRKKIRCNAEYLSTLLQVTKMCTNCEKTGDDCSFSRVPMKRGPSKGYNRDLVENTDSLNKSRDSSNGTELPGYRLRLKLVDLAGSNIFVQPNYRGDPAQTCPPSNVPQSSGKPHLGHHPGFTSTTQMTQPIILPPLVGAQPLTQPVKLTLPIPKYSNSVSPQTSGALVPGVSGAITTSDSTTSRIQGPLWKVPYEMPISSTPRSLVSSPGGSFDSRRSSIDSTASTQTSGSISRLPSFQHSSYFSEMEDTDSGRSEVPSPRNSISSLLLLNGRVTSALNLSQPDSVHGKNMPNQQTFEHSSQWHMAPQAQFISHLPQAQQPQPKFQNFRSSNSFNQAPPSSTSYSQSPSFTAHGGQSAEMLDSNLRSYYRSFHPAFPILLFDESLFPNIIKELQISSASNSSVIQFFLAALENLVNHQLIPFDAVRNMLLHFNSIYPFENSSSLCRNEILYLLFAGLLMINFTILLRGDSCSTGISLAHSAFTDFKVLQTFKTLSPSRIQELDRDDIQLYLPRLYLCLRIIDDCHALYWGRQSQIPKYSNFLLATLTPTFPQKQFSVQFLENIELGNLFGMLEDMKCEELFFDRPRSKKGLNVTSFGVRFSETNIALMIFCLQKDKYDLFDFAAEIHSFFESHSRINFEDEYTKDHIQDYQLKASRLVKKLSQSILNFAKHVSENGSQGSLVDETELVNPFLNICFGQSFRLIKISKDYLESLIKNAGDNEIISRSIRIIKDLSHATDLLSTRLNQSYKSGVNQLDEKIGPLNHMFLRGPGVLTAQTVSRKLEIYALNFQSTISIQLKKADSASFEAWRDDFMNTTRSLVFSENIDGWL